MIEEIVKEYQSAYMAGYRVKFRLTLAEVEIRSIASRLVTAIFKISKDEVKHCS
jgi:acetaldehyde dehydrogenase (acetylating)